MKPPPEPRYNWRLNNGLSGAYPHSKFYDLFVDGQYQHVWVREDVRTNKFYLGDYEHDSAGEFDSIQDAEDHLVVLQVIRRFERAYG